MITTRITRQGGSSVVHDPGHESDNPEHPNVHIAALFDGAIQFAHEAIKNRDVGNNDDVARRMAWVRAVLVDLAQGVRWGTGVPGRHISAIIMHLAQRLDDDQLTRAKLVEFASDLAIVHELWSVICGYDTTRRIVA
jgi:hypothetical protein